MRSLRLSLQFRKETMKTPSLVIATFAALVLAACGEQAAQTQTKAVTPNPAAGATAAPQTDTATQAPQQAPAAAQPAAAGAGQEQKVEEKKQ